MSATTDRGASLDAAEPTVVSATGAKVRRRSFLQGLGGIAGGLAIASPAMANNGWGGPALDQLSKEKLLDMYSKMLTSRIWEEGFRDMYLSGQDKLYGVCHLYIGEEAVACGAIGALNDDDYIVSTHRGHSHLINKGGDLNKMSAEMLMKADGYNKGYGGSMHITDVNKGILGMNGIVGASHILGAGAAYGIKVKGTKQVAVAFGGDGSVNNGWFYGALRNAALYKLPYICIVENNAYGSSVPAIEANPVKDLSTLGRGLEVPSYTVDGQDVFAVYSVMKRAVDRARAGEGPTLIEAKTYRYYDHVGVARAKVGVNGAWGLPYRSDRELAAWIANDPLPKFKTALISLGFLTEADATKLAADIKKKVDASIEFARKSPDPKPELGLENVYAQGAVQPSQMFA